MAAPLFSHPQTYLLKLAQCAHCSGANGIWLELRAEKVEVTFACPQLATEQLAGCQADLSPRPEFPTPLRLLLAAVRAALQFEPTGLDWGATGPSGGWAFRARGREARSHPVPEQAESRLFFAVDWTGRPAPNLQFLRRALRHSRLPVFVNQQIWSPDLPELMAPRGGPAWLCDRFYLGRPGLTLPHLTELPARLYDLGSGQPRLLQQVRARTYLQQWRGGPAPALSECEPARLPARALPLAQGQGSLWRRQGPLFYVPEESDLPRSGFAHPALPGLERASLSAEACLRLPARPERKPSRITWVQHGVCLEPIEAVMLMSDLHLVLADDAQATDLTGLRVVMNERFEEKLAAFNADLLILARELRRALNHHAEQGLSRRWVATVLQAQNLDIRD